MNTVKELAKKPVTTNGAAKTESPLSTVKAEPVPLTPTKKDEKSVNSLEDRLHRLNVLFDIQKKHAKCQEAKKELTAFTIAQNKENSTLELSDDEGNEFSTKNPVIIAEVVKMVVQKLNEKSSELEAQIIF